MLSQEFPAQNFVKAAKDAPYLEKPEELELARLWIEKRDQQALHKLTQAHMRLVISMAIKFKGYGLSLNDMIQEGHIGLLEAASRFDPDRDIRFSTYATWWIRASMQDYILRNWSIVRGGTSSNQKALFFKLRKLRAEIVKHGKAQNNQEVYDQISLALGVPAKDVASMDAKFSGDVSLNAPIATDDESKVEKQDTLECSDSLPDTKVSEIVDQTRIAKWLKQAFAVLNDRERNIISARQLRHKSETLESLGNHFGISKERVRQIEAKALEKLEAELVRINQDAKSVMLGNYL